MTIWQAFFRVIRLNKHEKILPLMFASLTSFIATAQIFEPILFGRVIDALSKEHDFLPIVSAWIVLGAINATLSIILSITSDRYAHRQRIYALETAFTSTIKLPFAQHSLTGAGKYVRTIQSGADHVFNIVPSFFRENLIAFFSVVIVVPMAFYQNGYLASALLALVVIYGTCNVLITRKTHGKQAIVELKHQGMTSRLIDVMANTTIVRSFNRFSAEVQLFCELGPLALKAQYPVLNWWGVANVITRLSAMIAMVAIVAIGSKLVQANAASQGEIVMFVGFSTLVINRLEQVSSFINRLMGQLPTIKNLLTVMTAENPEMLLTTSWKNLPLSGKVEFRSVSFKYQLHGGQGVKDKSFTAEPGQIVALVGATGAGKSTCMVLLQRLLSPDHGEILIDGQDISSLSVSALSDAIATVFQDPGLFNRSVFDNIAIGKEGATLADVMFAAKKAYAHDFILARPQAYDYVIGERGLALSGGERQRLAIARAFLKDASILILDEATSALDNKTEALVQAAMPELSRGRTTFVIAHRLSTIRSADLILVLDQGEIIERGTYHELINRKGAFSALVDAATWQHDVPSPKAISDHPLPI